MRQPAAAEAVVGGFRWARPDGRPYSARLRARLREVLGGCGVFGGGAGWPERAVPTCLTALRHGVASEGT